MKQSLLYEVTACGETDFPEVRFAYDLPGVIEVVAMFMFDAPDDESILEVRELCGSLDAESDMPWALEFEQGGIEVRKVLVWLPDNKE